MVSWADTVRLAITRADCRRVVELSESALPEEACALLGMVMEGVYRRLSIYPTENAFHSARAFCIRRVSVEAIKGLMRSDGVQLAGCFHSHPTDVPEPSELDRQSMRRLPLYWLIYSVKGRALRAFAGPRVTALSIDVI
jgi:proteasome lid subunit RPN8/RPN11